MEINLLNPVMLHTVWTISHNEKRPATKKNLPKTQAKFYAKRIHQEQVYWSADLPIFVITCGKPSSLMMIFFGNP
jgi:hypothetical protein